MLGVYTPPCFKKKKIRFFLWGKDIRRIFVEQLNTTTTMKITQDKKSTKLVKKFLQKTNSLTFQETWHGFGNVSVRIVSVGESDQYNWKDQQYGRVLNIEVTAKKTGYHFSENRIPSKHAWGQTQISFFKKRKSHAEFCFNKMIQKTKIPMFFTMAGIPTPRYGDNFMGNVTFKYID
jgi:hypothetical protein